MSTPLISLETAMAHLLSQGKPVGDTELVDLEHAGNRVLAADCQATLDVPPWDNSAMDGYALNTVDWQGADTELPLSQRIAAGSLPAPLQAGTVARIFTGAPIPEGADAVVMQEDTEVVEGGVRLLQQPRSGQHLRRRGSDLAAGDLVLARGTRLRPQHLGVLASLGLARVSCFRPLRVALVSTGDELAEPGGKAEPGQIYNSNRFILQGLLKELGMQPLDMGILPDRLDATCEALAKAAASADMVLSTGGVSIGEEDHVKPAVESLGRLDLWRLALKPGKPVALGDLQGTPFVGLPGNPVSVLMGFQILVRPALLRLQGATPLEPRAYPARADFERPAQTRREFLRVRAEHREGQLWVVAHPNQSSAVLTAACWAEGYALVPEGQPLGLGDPVSFLPYSELS